MPLKVEKVAVWSGTIEDKPGALAKVLEPLAAAGADLHVVLAERREGAGKVYLAPIKGRKIVEAARSVGLAETSLPVILRVEGTNRPGVGHLMTSALAEAGINLAFAAATVLGNKFVAFFGFDSDADARKASRILSTLKIPRR